MAIAPRTTSRSLERSTAFYLTHTSDTFDQQHKTRASAPRPRALSRVLKALFADHLDLDIPMNTS
jgi:hypothetical protein